MKKYLLIPSVLFVLTVFPQVSVAQNSNTNNPTGSNQNIQTTIQNPFRGGNNLFQFLEVLIDQVILPIGGILAVLAFIYTGFLFVTAQGNDEKLKTAKAALLYTAIGTAILLGAVVLTRVISSTITSLQ